MKTTIIGDIRAFFKPSLVVIYLYIILSFIAKPPIMSEVYVTYSIYMLISYSILVMFKQRIIYWSKYLTWAFLVMVLCFISILYAHHKEVAFNGIYTLLIPFVLAFSLVQLISTKEDIKNILIVLALSSGMLYVLMLRYNMFDITERLGNEMMGNANAFATMILLSVIAAICSIYLSKNKLLWVVMIVMIVIDFHMLFLSEGRKYLIAPIIFVLILSFKACGFKITRMALIVGIIAIATPIIYHGLLGLDIISESLIARLEMTFAMLKGQTDMMGEGDIERQQMISSGLRYFANSPLWGNGQGNFSFLFSLENISGFLGHYSHNNYVELLCNLGVIGFVLYYTFYYKILCETFKTNTLSANIVFSFFIVLMILELTIVSYYSQFLLQIIICLLSLTIYSRQKIKI